MADQKPRQLPPWMALQEGNEKSEAIPSRKTREQAESKRTVFYCMNEKELVEAAISYLQEHTPPHPDQQVIHSATTHCVNMKDGFTEERRVSELEAVNECSDSCDHERTCVSETDLDVTEDETIDYTTTTSRLGGEQAAEGQEAGPGPSRPVIPRHEGGRPEMHTQPSSTTADDDALRLVREIFFT